MFINVIRTTLHGDLAAKLRDHLHDVLSLEVDARPWNGASALPACLRDACPFVEAAVPGSPCLFPLERRKQRGSSLAIGKHIQEVSRKWQGDVVFVSEEMDGARRGQLIVQGVPFVVPGNQEYLPNGDQHCYPPRELAAAFGYSAMSMTRALGQRSDAGIGRHLVPGRQRCLEVTEPRRELWEKAKPVLRSPVVRLLAVGGDLGGKFLSAGLTALSGCGDLAGPRRPVVAVDRRTWSRVCRGVRQAAGPDEDGPSEEVEVWSYAPEPLAVGPAVDRLSPYLSLADTGDERVEAALQRMLGAIAW